MYGPIANLPGYNPNATYLPPGMAAPSSYPERLPPKQQFYDMPTLPSVTTGLQDLIGQGGLSSSTPNDSAFGGFGISGGIGGNAGGVDAMYGFQFPNNGSMDGLEYQFLNNFLAQNGQREQNWDNFTGGLPPSFFEGYGTSAPNFSGPSNDLYSGEWSPPYQPLPDGVAPNFTGPSGFAGDNWYSGNYSPTQSEFPLSPFNIQPSGLTQSQLDKLGQLPSLPDQGIGKGWNTAANLASLVAPPGIGMGINALYGLGTGLAGERLSSDPRKGFIESIFDPTEPGMIAKGANWLGRQLSGEEQSVMEGLQKAYGDSGNTTGAGAMAAPTDFGAGAYSGPHTQWYKDPNYMQFDQRGNWVNNPYSSTGNMLDMPMWGPGTKYAHADRFNTD